MHHTRAPQRTSLRAKTVQCSRVCGALRNVPLLAPLSHGEAAHWGGSAPVLPRITTNENEATRRIGRRVGLRAKHIGLMPLQRFGMRRNDLALRLMQRLAFE